MSAYINNEEKLILKSDEKPLLSALNRAKKALNEISNMGYTIYITPDGINAMVEKTQIFEEVVATISVSGIDCGDW